MFHRAVLVGLLSLVAAPLLAQDRVTKVLKDRERFATSDQWIYNDLEKGVALVNAVKRARPMGSAEWASS